MKTRDRPCGPMSSQWEALHLYDRFDRALWRPLLTVAGGYLVFGLLWILLSDLAVEMLSSSRLDLNAWQTYKELAFVGLSTVLVTGLLAHEARRRRGLDHYWRDIVNLADEGFWLIDASGRTRMVNRRMAGLLGHEPSDMLGRTPFDFVIEEDHGQLEHQIGRGPTEGLLHVEPGPRQYEVRLRHRDGHVIPCLVHATALRDERGVVTGSFAFMTDLTEFRQRERELHLNRHALDHSFDEIYRINRDGRILGANRAACENLGYYRNELIGRNIGDIDPHHSAEAWAEHWHELEQHGALTQETVHRTREGWEYPVEMAERYLVYGGEPFAFGVARDVRARNAAEASARRANEALRALSRANAALSQATDERDLFKRVCEALTSSRGYPLAWVGLISGDADPVVTVAASAGDAQPYLERLRVAHDDSPEGQGPTGKAIRTGQIQVLRDVDEDPDYAPWHTAATAYGFRTSVSLPIRVDDRIIGALNVYSTEPWAFDERELPLLEELAADLGFGVRTMEVRADRDRQLARLRLAGTVFDNSAEGILIADTNQRIEMINRAFTQITGYEAHEVIGQRPGMLEPDLHEISFYEHIWSQLAQEGYWQGELRSRRRNGEVYPQWLTISEVRDESGAVTHYVAIFADLTQAHQTQKELTFRTYHDPLTGLPNRTLFRQRLQQALDDFDPRLAVVLIDLQGFRALNDSFGAEGGDEVLRQTADRLRAVLRPHDLIARPGGDEFWITVHDEAGHPGIDEWIRKLMAAISEPMIVADYTVRLEANMGVALVPEDGSALDDLLTNAATALHRAQEQGRGQIDYFQPAMHEAVQRRVRVEEALKTGMETGELRVWYQPQVNLATGAICGAEALVRWRHPEWGLIMPEDFIPLSEASGLVVRIGDWVLEQALERLAQWREAGYPIERVSVNASPAQLQRPEWSEFVHATLERTGVPPHCLEIEITEEGVLDNMKEALTTMEWLKALDIRLAIDDFGKGYSSLAYLKQFPIDTLKIDKSFVDGLPHVEYDCSIAEAMLAVSRALGFEVVAEGVETTAQAEWLRQRGVPLAQGFLFYRPQPPGKMEMLLDESDEPIRSAPRA